MVAIVKPVVITFLADDKKFNRGISNVEGRLDKLSRQAGRAGAALTVGVTAPLVALGKVAFDAASDLEQSVGAVDSVFGDSADVIEAWAKTAAQAAGLSEREVNEMAAKVGAGLQGLGFDVEESADLVVDLEKRAADLAATFGGKTADAIDAIAALMRGERDPIEKFGVSIKQADVNARVLALGLDTSTTAAEKNAQAVATLDLLMEQTAKTQGAFARETDTAAGSQARARAEFENAAAALGESLLPIGAKAAEVVGSLADAFNNLSPEVQDTIVKVGIAAAALGPLLLATSKVIGAVGTLKTVLNGATGAMGKGGFAGGAALLSAVAIPALVTQFTEAENHITHLTNAMLESADVARNLAIEVFKTALGPALLQAGVSADEFKTALEGDTAALERINDVAGVHGALLDELVTRYQLARERADHLTQSNLDLANAINGVGAAATLAFGTSAGAELRGQGFQHGGTVSGAPGQPQMALVHGGETITPPVKQAAGPDIIQLVVDGRVLAEAVRRSDRAFR